MIARLKFQLEKRLSLLLVAVLIILPGCIQESMQEPTETWPRPVVKMDDSGCADYVCKIENDSEVAGIIQKEFGLSLLTNGSFVTHHNTDIDGDWVVWEGHKPVPPARSDVYALHLPSKEVFGLSMGPGAARDPKIENGQAIFSYYSVNRTGLVSWKTGDNETGWIETGLVGSHRLLDFEGDWIAFQFHGYENNSSDGIWTMNIDSEEIFQLQSLTIVPADNDTHDLRYSVMDVDLGSGSAYMLIRTETPVWEPRHYNYIISRIDLATLDSETFEFDGSGQPYAFEATNQKVVLGLDYGFFSILDIHTREFTTKDFRLFGYETCRLSGGQHDVFWLACRQEHVPQEKWTRYFQILNLETNSTIYERQYQRESDPEDAQLFYSDFATDGQTIVIQSIPWIRDTLHGQPYGLLAVPVDHATG